MAGVPFNPLPTVTASPSGGALEFSRVQANPDAFGAGIGRAESQLGAQVEHSADKVFAAAMDFQKRQDDTDVDAVYSTQFSPQFRDLYQKYYSLQGKDAVDGMAPYLTRMKELQQQTVEGLPNERQKHLFNSLSRRRVEMEMDGMARYADQQNKVYGEQTFKATNDNLILQAADKHNDEAAFGATLGSMAFNVDKYAATTGKSAEWARDKINDLQSEAAVTRLQRQMIDAPEEADKWYRANSSMIAAKARPMLEHQLKAAVMPIEIRQKADAIIGPDGDAAIKAAVSGGAPFPAAGPQAGADGVVRVSAPDEATAVRMAEDARKAGKGIAITVGDATPATPRDTRAMLGTWIAKAEAEYPNDPVKRDALIAQVKNRVSTIVAIQNGVQQQAHSTLTKAMMSSETPPTSVGDLTATPQGAQAWALQSPEAQRGFIAWMDQNQRKGEGKAIKSSVAVNEEVFNKIASGEIFQPGQLAPYFARGLTKADYEWHTKLIEEKRTPDGQRISDVRKNFFDSIKPRFDSSTLTFRDEKGGEDNFKFQQYALNKEREMRAAGKDPYVLYNPTSKEYIGNDVPTFQRSLAEKVQSRVDQIGANAPVTYNGYRFPNQKALDDYKKAGGK